MSREDYQPGAAAGAHAEEEGERCQLVFVRELKSPPDEVWRALTDPAQLGEWAPFDADRDLGRTGPATLTMAGGSGSESFECVVREAEAPRVLEYSWGNDVLRWELAPLGSGTRLTLRQSLEDRGWLARVAAGWHICLDVAARALEGPPIGRIVAGEARGFGWERLEAEYAEQLGVESQGWPGSESSG